mmetsp:Transcript_143902/g.261814  ORF Transcript_143902/g.261814 Transcript_143902/m.261814 type:complete len:307 (-) Transcript_143902:108-1028(-)
MGRNCKITSKEESLHQNVELDAACPRGQSLHFMNFPSDSDFSEASPYNPHGVMQNCGFEIGDWQQALGPAFAFWNDCETHSLPYAEPLSDSMLAQLSCEVAQAYSAPPQFSQAGFHMLFPAQHEEQSSVVGTSAWAEAVKHSARESESTSDGPTSDNVDSPEEELEVYSPGKSEGQASIDHTPPVRRTFIHFDNTVSLTRCDSAPDVLSETPFRRKYNPEMQEQHMRGDCRPCAYFVHKEDGCRLGVECQFCHLCPAEAVKKRKKEKVKAMKEEAARSQMPRHKSHRNSGWKGSGEGRQGRRHWVK